LIHKLQKILIRFTDYSSTTFFKSIHYFSTLKSKQKNKTWNNIGTI